MNAVDARFPIGRLFREGPLSPARRAELIAEIASLPAVLRQALEGMRETEWESRYRDGGWTVRQVVHHIADSHVNAYVRFRLALTEDVPTIKPYSEQRWADLPDVGITDPAVSLQLLESLHARLAALLEALPASEFARELYHPEQEQRLSLDDMVALYAWHGRHHTAHVTRARELAGERS